MGTDEKKKKTIGEQYQEGWNAYADSVNQTAADMAAQQKAADEAYLQSMAVAEQQRQQTAEQNYNRVADLLKQGYSAQEAMLRASQANVQKAEVEDAVKYKADLNAAKYTGLTELASSVANMIGVGSFNAANQQYRQYSQDWMRKADQDMRLRRARIDNLRERQRAMQNRLDQLRQSNNLTLLQQQAAEDAARNKYATDRANVQRESALAQAKIIAGANNDAAQARLKGQTAAVEANEQQRQFNARLADNAAARAQSDRHFNAQLRAKGLNADGSLNPDYVKENAGWTKDKQGRWVAPKGSGADDTINFRVNKYGDDNAFDWQGSASRLAESLLTSIDTFTDLSNDAKGQITEILTGSGKGADKVDAIKRYIGTSPQMREFVKTLNERNIDNGAGDDEESGWNAYLKAIQWNNQQ